MPTDKPIQVLTYAASASLAAVALVYLFNPNYIIDGANSDSSKNKKTGIVGLVNTANDCFTNSSLQALAGLGDLRLFLIRELHRRKLSDPDVYRTLPDEEDGKPLNRRKLLGLQSGDVTQALKTILDQLNERPLRRKTITARPFILTLERAFETRISREQQDAQELLQIIAERVCDEYHAGRDARKRARKDIRKKLSSAALPRGLGVTVEDESGAQSSAVQDDEPASEEEPQVDDEIGFPMEGQTESQIHCSHCGFSPKSSPVSFVMLTLTVPHKNSATLNECFDAHFKREIIEDYKCDKCRLEHAISVYEKELDRASTESTRVSIEEKLEKLRLAMSTDPEKPPEDVTLPHSKTAPTRRIERHVRITRFPQVLVIHLSRSIYDVRSASAKNMAKVSFPEKLPLGGLLNRRNYKLLGLIAHKGTHNSGHYECFRRQHVPEPYSRPHVDPETGPYSSVNTPRDPYSLSPKVTPTLRATIPTPRPSSDTDAVSLATSSSPPIISGRESVMSAQTSTTSSLPSRTLSPSNLARGKSPNRLSMDSSLSDAETGKEPSTSRRSSIATATAKAKTLISETTTKHKSGKKRADDRWWRISDDKIKECKTAEVMDMQREVYMLFYEMEKVR